MHLTSGIFGLLDLWRSPASFSDHPKSGHAPPRASRAVGLSPTRRRVRERPATGGVRFFWGCSVFVSESYSGVSFVQFCLLVSPSVPVSLWFQTFSLFPPILVWIHRLLLANEIVFPTLVFSPVGFNFKSGSRCVQFLFL